jgi:hypothetical protein
MFCAEVLFQVAKPITAVERLRQDRLFGEQAAAPFNLWHGACDIAIMAV